MANCCALKQMAVLFMLLMGFMAGTIEAVTVADVTDEGQAAFKVTSNTATFYLQKQAGGFSSLVDKSGKDWISASSASGASGMYRGIPNLVYPGDIYHPMWNHCNCTQKSATSAKVSIECTSGDKGGWAVLYEFYDDRADLTVTKKGSSNYWFLYEGTPNGKFDGNTNYLYRSDTKDKHYLKNAKEGDIKPISGQQHEWIYFSDNAVSRGLLMILHKDDSNGDRYYAMSPMTVFGFGRPSGATSALTAVPNKFSVALVEETSWDKIAALAQGMVTGETTAAHMPHSQYPTASQSAIIRQTSPSHVAISTPSHAPFDIRIVDMNGRVVAARQNVAGEYVASNKNLGSGLFFAQIRSGTASYSRCFVLTR